MTKGSDTIFAH